MAQVTGTLTSVGQRSESLYLRVGEQVTVNVSRSGSGSWAAQLVRVIGAPPAKVEIIETFQATATGFTYRNTSLVNEYIAVQLREIGVGATVSYTVADVFGDQILQEWRAADGTLAFRITDQGPVGGQAGPTLDVKAFGAKGDGVTDDTAAINATIVAAAAFAVTHGRAVVLLPSATYAISGRIIMRSNITVINQGVIKLVAPTGLGGAIVFDGTDNAEYCGGVLDCNLQAGDNGIGVGGERTNTNYSIHDTTVKNCRLSGVSPGTGGGKGITLQHGANSGRVYGVTIQNCTFGITVEGKTDWPAARSAVENALIEDCAYGGLLLWGTSAGDENYGDLYNILLSNIVIANCATGESGYAGVVCNFATYVYARGIRVFNNAGRCNVIKGAVRFSDIEIQADIEAAYDLIDATAYSGFSAQASVSRYGRICVWATVRSPGATGYLINADAGYQPQYMHYEVRYLQWNGSTFFGTTWDGPGAYQNLETTCLYAVVNLSNGRRWQGYSPQPLTNITGGIDNFLGIGITDDAGNNLSRITPSRTNLAFADASGVAQALVSANGLIAQRRFIFNRGADLTIASGGITTTHSSHRVDTQGAAATDDLDNIFGGVADQVLVLRTVNSGRDVVVKHATGNIRLAGGTDKTLDDTNDRIVLQYDGTNWVQWTFSDNA